jgi:hypothetical protein
MDKRDLIRRKLLELGGESISSYVRAKQKHARNGDEKALNDMIKAAILYHGVCQIAEATGIASYGEFELELAGGREEARPALDLIRNARR